MLLATFSSANMHIVFSYRIIIFLLVYILHLQTNDFFVSTWGKSGEYDGIVQFKGFAPGLDIDVVTENIQNEMKLVLQILFNASDRRKLGRDASAQVQLKLKYLRGRRNLENKGQGADHKADPCKKANLNAAHGLEMAGKNCNKETVIPPAEESE